MKAGLFLWLGMPVFSTLSQLFIKLTSERLTGSGWTWLGNVLTSPWMIALLGVEIALFFIWMRVLTELDLSKAYPISAISYILILATGWLVFGESVSRVQLIGSGLNSYRRLGDQHGRRCHDAGIRSNENIFDSSSSSLGNSSSSNLGHHSS